MRCRFCKRDIPYNSIYCNWCGTKQIAEYSRVKVPAPKVLKNGNYFAQIRVDGTRVSVSEPTMEEYYEKAIELKTGKIKPSATMTLGEAIDRYDKDRANRLQVRSVENHKYIKDHRFPELMKKRICDITDSDLDKAIEKELSRPSRKGGTISPKTVNDSMGLVKSVLYQYADRKPRTRQVKEQKRIKDYPTAEQIVNAVVGTDIELPCLLALWLGMSMEEIRGLTKSKSIKNGKLCIVESVVDTKSGAIRKAGAKAKERVRTYNIPQYISNLIDKVDGDVIEPRSGHAIYMRLQVELKKHNLNAISFHDLRHINTATLTANPLIPSKTIQSRNGWSSDRMIKEVYDYVYDVDRQYADNYMDSLFNEMIAKKHQDG